MFFRSPCRFAVQVQSWIPLGLPLAATATWRPGDGTQPPQSHVMRRVGLGANHGRSQTNFQVDLDATLIPFLLRLLPPQINTDSQIHRVRLQKSPYLLLELISVGRLKNIYRQYPKSTETYSVSRPIDGEVVAYHPMTWGIAILDRQHNGEITAGAWKTKHKRPWIMQMIVHGFPSKLVREHPLLWRRTL